MLRLRMNSFLYIFVIIAIPVHLYAFTLTAHEGARKNTREVLKSQVKGGDVQVIFNKKLRGRCEFLGRVTTSKKVELWEKSKSCTVRIESLRKEAAFVKANTLYVDIETFGCDGKVMSGEAYFCSSSMKN